MGKCESRQIKEFWNWPLPGGICIVGHTLMGHTYAWADKG